jgi:hypothetical protein
MILMQVGSEDWIGPEIVALGFDTKEEITLPGLIIKNNSEKTEKNEYCCWKENFGYILTFCLPAG